MADDDEERGPPWVGSPAVSLIPPPPGAPGVPPPPVPASDLAYLDLTVQGNRMTSNMIPPHVTVNGRPLVDAYGYRRVPVPAGLVRIEVECRWTKTFGQAAMTLSLAPGQAVPVFYAAPASVFSRGKIGHVKQRRTTTAVLLAVVGIVILVPTIVLVAAALAAA